jgi:hypothetical protein
MNMIARKFKPALIDGDDVLAVLDRRLHELMARDAVLLKQQIMVEKTPSVATTDRSVERAEALLDGSPFVVSREIQISQLDAIKAERHGIAAALKIGNSKKHRLATERAGQIWAEHFSEIAEIEKRRVFLAFELQRTNRAREKLREKITRAGGAGFLSTDGVDLLGLGELAELQWAANRLIADGIATTAEIEKARS